MVDSSTSQAKKYPTQLPSPKSVHLRPQYASVAGFKELCNFAWEQARRS